MRSVGLVFIFVFSLALALGQSSSSGDTVQVNSSDTYGSYLVNSQGLALYMLSADSKDASTCADKCAQAWPPLTVSGSPSAGSGVAGTLLGTITRADGSRQVTYNGMPLYTFVKDQAVGDTNGEGVNAFGGEWDLASPYGSAIKPKESKTSENGGGGAQQEAQSPQPMNASQLGAEGESIYSSNCSVCHGPSGGGKVGPKLVGNQHLADAGHVIHQILNGSQMMPPIGAAFSDEQVAAVATYVRTAWGNDFGPVSPSAVKNAR